MICVSLAESNSDALLGSIEHVGPKADLIEIRLDTLKDPDSLDIEGLISARSCPLIFTNRSEKEGGNFSGPEEKRIGLLERAILAGADYIDLELRTEPTLRDVVLKKIQEANTRLIISYHDFTSTPSMEKLIEVFDSERQTGADIGKIVTMAEGPRDILRIFSLYARALDNKFSLIAFCMGAMGKISRLACLSLGAYLTYASPSKGHEAAPGQIPLDDLRAMVDYLNNSGEDGLKKYLYL
ncbi:MAG: type I 3-dehydroquinate dehydratase [Nitrospiraceae bacterium]|nr:type I 3-dehydroquinate dehydratase [Nitrospiraceae bacterium]